MLQTPVLDPARVREVFQEVLSQPEFQYRGTAPVIRWIGALLELIGDAFRRFLPMLGDTQVRVLSWLVMGGVGLAGVYAAWRWAAGARDGSGERPPASEAGTLPRDSAGWVQWARDQAGAGRLREAATGLYQSAVLHLDSRGLLRYREWKTPGDYAHEIPADDAIRGSFLEFLGRFVEMAFGRQEPTAEAFERLSARAAQLGCPI